MELATAPEEIKGRDGDRDMSEAIKKQVFEMSAGIVLHNLFLTAGAILWFRELSVFLGIAVGTIFAIALLCSMAYSTELCIEFADEEFARKKMTMHAMLRTLAVFAGVIVVWKVIDINPLALVLALFGLKTGTYLYPFIHRLFDHKAGEKA